MRAFDAWSPLIRLVHERHRINALPESRAQAHIDGDWPRHQPARGEWIWRDLTGAGDFSRASFDQSAALTDAPALRGWWVDSRGDVWQGM